MPPIEKKIVMSKDKYTPGPWQVEEWRGNPLSVTTPEFVIATVEFVEPRSTKDEGNARLIAAAPDMLAALLAFNVAYESEGPDYSDKINEANILMVAALAKALSS